MIVKTITYTDFTGLERTEDHYFHLFDVEVTKLHSKLPGGIGNYGKMMLERQDPNEVMAFLDLILETSYGVLSPDGIHLRKKKEYWEDFTSSGAYDVLVKELIKGDGSAFGEFMEGVVSSKASGSVKNAVENVDESLALRIATIKRNAGIEE